MLLLGLSRLLGVVKLILREEAIIKSSQSSKKGIIDKQVQKEEHGQK